MLVLQILLLPSLACVSALLSVPRRRVGIAAPDRLIPLALEGTSSSIETPESWTSAREARIFLPFSIALGAPSIARALPKTPEGFDNAVKQYFSGALANSVITLRLSGTLRKRGFFPYNTIMASSFPLDELNDAGNGLVPGLRSKFLNADTGVFAMGGITGVPSRSKVGGVEEFCSHSPADGKLLIVCGSSVGVDKEGHIGLVERFGQESSTPAPGILSGLASGQELPGVDKDVSSAFSKRYKETSSQAIPEMVAASLSLYGVILDDIVSRVSRIAENSDTWKSVNEIVIMGGTSVNRGRASGLPKGEDLFQPLTLKSFGPRGETQLYDEVFGDLSTPRNFV